MRRSLRSRYQARPTTNRSTRRRGIGARLDPAKLVGAAFAILVVCSLVAAGLGSTLFDRSTAPEPAEEGLDAGGGEFERSLREAIAANPNDSEAMISLATFLATLGNREEAIDWYEQAVDVEPDNLQYRLAFAGSLADFGDLADAEVQYQRALQIDPESVEAHFYLAELYGRWQPPRLELAAAGYQRVIALAPDSYLAERATEELARLGRPAGSPAASPAGA